VEFVEEGGSDENLSEKKRACVDDEVLTFEGSQNCDRFIHYSGRNCKDKKLRYFGSYLANTY
jgi:hypothetical protein